MPGDSGSRTLMAGSASKPNPQSHHWRASQIMDKFWKQITPSDYAWEQEALGFVKAALPDHEPYRAWANFEFITKEGFVNEVDLLVHTQKGLFLVEIKSHPGVMKGDAGTWVWESPEGKRKAFDNPLLLTDRNAPAAILNLSISAMSTTCSRRFRRKTTAAILPMPWTTMWRGTTGIRLRHLLTARRQHSQIHLKA